MLRRLALTALLAPTVLAGQEPAPDLFRWSGRLAANATFSIRHYNGPIDVGESTSDQVEFRAERRSRRSGEVTFEVQNQGTGGVTICGVWRGRNACDEGRRAGWDWDDGPPSTRLSVLLPRGVRLRANTGNGDVTIERASNDVEVRSGNGDVRIKMTAGQVDANTGNGELEVDGATGPVRANTGNGRVYVLTSTGPVNVHTGNGEIDVRMKTVSPTADMEFTTGNGSVTVALPAAFNGSLDASTGHGEFRSDFEIRIVGRLNPRHVRGTIGAGGNGRIRMSSGNGRLELRRVD
jgi:hypothetical protein